MGREAVKKKRIRNPEQTRAKLLRAAAELISEKGVEALSMKEAAVRADVSRSVAYLHFENREDLVHEVRSWISSRLQDGVKRFDEKTPLYDRILYTTKLVLAYPEASRIMIMNALAGGELHLHDPLFKLVFKRLKRLRDSGKLRPGIDLEISTYIHLGSIATTLLLWEQHKDGDIDELAARFAKEWSRIVQDSIFLPEP